MTVKTRILALKLLNKLEHDPDYADKIGIWVEILPERSKQHGLSTYDTLLYDSAFDADKQQASWSENDRGQCSFTR